MATRSWQLGLNGNWADANRWSTGIVPTAADEARITAPGTYTVTISAAAFADLIFIRNPNVTVRETAAGSITANTIILSQGTLDLRAANSIDEMRVFGGVLKLGHASALGGGTLTLGGGTALGTITETIANAVTVDGTVDGIGTIAAAAGTTLTLDGSFTFDSSPRLIFGDALNNGTIVVSFGASSFDGQTIEIGGGTVTTNDGSLLLLTTSSNTVQIDAGATLDANDHGLVLNTLIGAGTVTNSGASVVQVGLGTGNFAGTIRGNIQLDATSGATVTGTVAPKGGTVIGGGKSLTIGDGGTTGTIKGEVTGSGTLIIDRSGTIKLGADLATSINLTLNGPGTVKIDRVNSYTGTTTINAGSLSLSAGAAGSSDIQFHGGEILAAASFNLTNVINIDGEVVVAAATGTVFGFNPGVLNLDGTLVLGTADAAGTIVFDRGSGGTSSSSVIDIRAGTVQLADNSFGFYTENGGETTIEAGATLDLLGQSPTFNALTGAGTLTTTSTGEVRLMGANFAGTISGNLGLRVLAGGSAVFTGTATHTFGTTVEAGAALSIGDGGTTGTIAGDIFTDGQLFFAHSDNFNFGDQILGDGSVTQFGSGTLKLGGFNDYTGGTFVQDGVLVSDKNGAGAIGTGDLHVDGGEFRAGQNQTLINVVSVDDDGTISAAHNKTLTLTGKVLIGDASTHLTFGSAGNDGTVVLTPAPLTSAADGYTLEVAAGTLVIGGGTYTPVTTFADHVIVGTGATFDVAGHLVNLTDLTGKGVLTNTGALSALVLRGGDFDGQVNGNIVLNIQTGFTTLSGGGNFGKAIIFSNATLHLEGTADEDVAFQGSNTFLELDNANKFTGTVSDFTNNDGIDLTNLDFAGASFSFNATTDVLTVSDAARSVTIQFEDGYTTGEFSLADDGGGHVRVLTTIASPHAIGPEPFMELG